MSHSQKRYFCSSFKTVFHTAIPTAHSVSFLASEEVGHILVNYKFYLKSLADLKSLKLLCSRFYTVARPKFCYEKNIQTRA